MSRCCSEEPEGAERRWLVIILTIALVESAILLGIGIAAAISAPAAATDDDRSVICRRGHSETLRLPAPEYYALRDVAFARAGVPVSRQCHPNDSRPDCFILDHIVPLELCLASDNCNRVDNIQIQTKADAEAKDRIENEERTRFCRGEKTRQQAISHFTRAVP